MADAGPGSHPLDVPTAKAPSIAQRVGVVHPTASGHRDGLEAAVRVLREAGDLLPVGPKRSTKRQSLTHSYMLQSLLEAFLKSRDMFQPEGCPKSAPILCPFRDALGVMSGLPGG